MPDTELFQTTIPYAPESVMDWCANELAEMYPTVYHQQEILTVGMDTIHDVIDRLDEYVTASIKMAAAINSGLTFIKISPPVNSVDSWIASEINESFGDENVITHYDYKGDLLKIDREDIDAVVARLNEGVEYRLLLIDKIEIFARV